MKDWYIEILKNREAYACASPEQQSAMETRALAFAALTIHAPWKQSYQKWYEGKEYVMPPLPSAQRWLLARWGKNSDFWFNHRHNEKVKFARMLAGIADEETRDTLMNRYFPHARVTGVGQWALWFYRAYPARFKNRGPQVVNTLIAQHIDVLHWVRTGQKEG
jgi:hypothetical protein